VIVQPPLRTRRFAMFRGLAPKKAQARHIRDFSVWDRGTLADRTYFVLKSARRTRRAICNGAGADLMPRSEKRLHCFEAEDACGQTVEDGYGIVSENVTNQETPHGLGVRRGICDHRRPTHGGSGVSQKCGSSVDDSHHTVETPALKDASRHTPRRFRQLQQSHPSIRESDEAR